MSLSREGNDGCEFDENVELLRTVPHFSDMPVESVRRVALLCRRAAYRAGDAVFSRGETDRNAYVVIRGEARVVLDEREIGEFRTGAFFGGLGLLDGVERLFTVLAHTGLTCLVLPGDSIREYLCQAENEREIFLRVMVARIVDWEKRELARGPGPHDPGVSLL